MDDAEEKILEASYLITDDSQAALALAMPFAERGYSEAQFLVGFIFADSYNRIPPGLRGEELDHWFDSVSRDQWEAWQREDAPQALHWFVQAGELGNPEAVLLAKHLAERLQYGNLPWQNATGKRRELLDLAEMCGLNMLALISTGGEGLTQKEYLYKYMGKAKDS